MAEQNSIFLGIDSGSSGCRIIAINSEKQVLANCEIPHPAIVNIGNKIEFNAQDWWRSLCSALEHIGAKIKMSQIAALAVDATSGSLVLCDQYGEPSSPALMYNDRQASKQAALISDIAPVQSGAHGTGSGLAKLLFLLQQGYKGHHALHHHDWLCGKLCGRWGISDENNSLKLGYDAVKRTWPDWLQQFKIPTSILPEVSPPGTIMAPIDQAVCARFGIPRQAQLIAGTTDSVAATLACGVERIGDAVTSLGSTLVLKIVSAAPVFVPEFGIYSHRLADRWLAGGASNTGGAVLKYFFSTQKMKQLSLQIDPDNDSDLEYYPLLSPGERFPTNDPALKPKLEPRPKNDAIFFKGLLQGIAEIESRGYRLLHEHGTPYPSRIYSAGGGAGNQVWSRMRQRKLKVQMCTAKVQQTAFGAALIARAGFYHENIL